MVSKNNQWQHLQVSAQRVPHYGLRKLSVGVASVLLSTTLYMGVSAHADTVTTPSETSTPVTAATTPSPMPTETTGDTAGSSNSGAPSNSVSETPTSQGTPEKSGAGSGSADSNGATPVQPAVTATPTSKPVAGDETPKAGSETPASNATQNETVNSQWIIHYVNQVDHKQELKDPTVITLQYTRTNTSQSDGTTKYGDWSYVPGSFKQTGTPITVNDGDNPVKQDNIDKDGENMDSFTITAMYPTITGYAMHNNINGTRLHDYLRNNDRQADTMSKDFYAEYDVAKERSVNVKFVDDQSFDPNVSGGKSQVGQAITLTGRDGDTVKVNVTVPDPDKYQLADGQQLPTTYTFTAGSGDVTIHLVHKVVQREATVDVKLVMMNGVDIQGVDVTRETVTQERWGQLGEEFNAGGPGALLKILPSVEVGTLTGRVNYDVVDSKVVSFGDDWTTLNLGGHTYQLSNGVDVVNGVLIDSDDGSLGKPLREYYLTHYSIVNPGHSVDSDYATRPWYGYLSVNETNDPNSPVSEWNDLGLQGGLAGNEPNALAKATGDRAATAVEMANETIEASVLGLDAFSEQDGRLQATLPVPVYGVYIPYVEKTATRTINVTTPDGKTSTVKQTATLEKQVDLRKDAHPDWTTGEWTSYDVPTIPGYTASQSNVAKEAVTGETKDQIVNITYTANPQTATVVYQTEDGTSVHATTVNGQTGQTVKVSSEVPAGWKIVNGKVPSEITFGADGAPKTVVTIAHQHVTVDPDQPQNNGTKLPDNPAKTFEGVEANDLNKTITRTIKVTTPDGQTKTVAQTAKLTRTSDVDEVTGEVTYGKWTTGQWSNYDVPTVSGYTASQNEVPATEVTSDMTDQTVNVSYTANSQTIHINYVDDNTGKIVYTTAVTGKTGETVSLNLTVPDKYQLADGQQLPTTYTFAAYNGDVTIDLTHKVVQREATIDAQIELMTTVYSGNDDDDEYLAITVTQNQWHQLDNKIKDSKNVNSDKLYPLIKVGTLTGHANYDLVDNKVVSFADDWTTLNLGGQTYQMPDGTEVVNGMFIKNNLTWGKTLKEELLKYHPDVDPDYVNRPWHGYLSVNKTNMIASDLIGDSSLQSVLVENEPNALAKAIGDQAATVVKMANKTIDFNWLNDNVSRFEFSEQNGQLRADGFLPVMGVYIPYVEKTATRTINVTAPDGKMTTVKQTATLEKQVDLSKDAHPDWTTGEWTSYDVPTIPGYTASQSNVAKEAVTGETKDQIVNITYTANPQTATVVYQTEDGTSVHTTTVKGQTGQTVKVSNEVPVGWKIINGKVSSEITFGSNGTPQTVVTIAHQHVTVKPDAPKTTVDHLPDNSNRTYPAGVSESDLNKTITGTIKITMPDGQVKTVLKTAKLTRTADVDEVTGGVKYSNWTTGYWSDYTAPVVPGYTADVPYIAGQLITDMTEDQTIEITYTANPQTIHVNYVDTQGKIMHTTTVNGKTGQTVKVSSEIPDGWKLVDGQTVPTTITFGPDGHADMSVHIEHQHVTVTSDKPQANGTKLPDNPAKTFNGVEVNDLNKTITRTIKVTTPDGKATTTKQTAKLTRTADVDEVTGEVTYGNWTTSEWAAYNTPSVAGYAPSQTVVSKESVTATSKDTAVEITYSPVQHQISVEYVDDDDHGKIVKTDQVPGKTDQTITVTPSAPANYDLVDNGNQTYTVTSYDAQVVQIHVKHHQVTTSESKTVTRTINVHTPHDGTKVVKQTAKLTRNVTTDQVTGEKTYGDWTTGQWKAYTPEAIPGYTSSINEVPNVNIDGKSKNQMVDVAYTADAQKVEIVYVDDTKGDAVVKTDQIIGKTDETVKVTPDVPTGYELVGKVLGDYTMTADGHQTITVHLAHQMKTVSESKTVTRTINVHTPHDGTKVVKQTAKLTRDVTTDQVTGEKTYGDWSVTEWDRYAVPVVAGYVPNIEQVVQQVVNGTTMNQTIDVTYSSGEHTTHINYVDKDGNIVHTTTIKGQTDGTAQVPNETPAGWTVVGEPVPTELAFGPDGHADVTVTVAHQHVIVTPDQPKTSTDKLPDNPAKTYPNGVDHDDLNETITRTIKVTTPDGQIKTVAQTVKLTRTANVDEVTGAVTYGNWTTGEWLSYDVPTVPGYTASQSEVPATKVTNNAKDQTVTVTYTANDQTTHIDYVDGNGKIFRTTTVTGKTGQTVKVPNEIPAGWTITDGQVPSEVTFGANGHSDVTVTVDHQHVTVTPDKPQTDGTPLPDNPGQTFHGVNEIDLNKTITRTIVFNVPGQNPRIITQTAKLTRTATVDEVTGEVIYGDWTTAKWPAVTVPVVDGYNASQAQIPAVTVEPTTDNQMVTVDYQAVEIPTTPTTEVHPTAKTLKTTSNVHVAVTSASSKAKSMATSAGQPTAAAPKATQLPQTGDNKVASATVASLGLLLSTLSAFVFGRKRKGKGHKA